jgi:hypothetical protein
MSDESIQATAENLRADFLNATTTHARWHVLNRAIEWAVAASENADHYRQKAQSKEHTVNLTLDSADLVEERHFRDVVVRGSLFAGEERHIRAGDIVTWDGEDEGWIVEVVRRDARVTILPLGDDYALARTTVAIQDVWPPDNVIGPVSARHRDGE